MSILTMPSTPNFRRVTFTLKGHTQTGAEVLSQALHMKRLGGARWAARYELPPMKRAQAAAWCAFLARLNGTAGRFYGFAPDATTARGAAAGTPRVNLANQTGSYLTTDGWTAGTVPLLTGDYVAFNTPSGWRELHKVTADAGTAGSVLFGDGNFGDGYFGYGEAGLAIAPPIRESPGDNATLIVTAASCVMRLIDDEQAAWDVQTAEVYGLQFSAEEVWPTLAGAMTGTGALSSAAATLAGAGTVA